MDLLSTPALGKEALEELDIWSVEVADGKDFLIDLHWHPRNGGYIYHGGLRYEIEAYQEDLDKGIKKLVVKTIGKWC